jgi:hypothetical protein
MVNKERSQPMNKFQMLVSFWQFYCCWWDAFGVWVSCVMFVWLLWGFGSEATVLISTMAMVYELLKCSYIMGYVGTVCQPGEVFYFVLHDCGV